MPYLPGQIVPAGTFTKKKMSVMDRVLAQALQNVSPVEVAYTTAYDGADQKTAHARGIPRLRKTKKKGETPTPNQETDFS